MNPVTAQDVSTAIGILAGGNCPFAVVSGGHMFWKGASNMAAPGIVIDMMMFTSISLSSDKKVVSVGPGSNFRAVYEKLSPFNLTVAGARSNTVGVGGFLLGGEGNSLAATLLIYSLFSFFHCRGYLQSRSTARIWERQYC